MKKKLNVVIGILLLSVLLTSCFSETPFLQDISLSDDETIVDVFEGEIKEIVIDSKKVDENREVLLFSFNKDYTSSGFNRQLIQSSFDFILIDGKPFIKLYYGHNDISKYQENKVSLDFRDYLDFYTDDSEYYIVYNSSTDIRNPSESLNISVVNRFKNQKTDGGNLIETLYENSIDNFDSPKYNVGYFNDEAEESIFKEYEYYVLIPIDEDLLGDDGSLFIELVFDHSIYISQFFYANITYRKIEGKYLYSMDLDIYIQY
jgi:hypothetical protein